MNAVRMDMKSDEKYAIEYLVNIYFGIDFSSPMRSLKKKDVTEIGILDSIVDHAYTDATNQKAFNAIDKVYDQNIFSNSDKKIFADKINICKENAANTIIKGILDQHRFSDQKDFCTWHNGICENIKDAYEKVKRVDNNELAFTYGNAQKWLNMTIKNLYALYLTFGIFRNNDENNDGVREFHDELKDFCDNPEWFHLPVDSYIIYTACKNEIINQSNQLDFLKEEYKDKQPGTDRRKALKTLANPENYIVGWSNWDKSIYINFIDLVKAYCKKQGVSLFQWEEESWIRAKDRG